MLRLGPDRTFRPAAARASGQSKPRGLRAALRPRRQGDDPTVYAVGDVHGCYNLLVALLEKLAGDMRPDQRPPVVVFCGDYIDRGPDSARVLEALCWLRSWDGWNLQLLKGNHEQGLLRFLDEPAGGAGWLRFGGAETLWSYGVEPPPPDAPPIAWSRARDALLQRMPAAHLRLLQTLELMVVVGDHAFVHAGVAPGTPLNQQIEDDLLWIRDEFLDADRPHDKVIVHGHTWIDDLPVLHKHRIGLDTGAYATGVLTAVRLSGARVETLQVRDPTRAPWPRSPQRVPTGRRLVARPAEYVAPPGELRVSAPVSQMLARPAPQPPPADRLQFSKAGW